MARSELHPDRVAVVDPDGIETTFSELAEHVNRLSHGLRALGIKRGGAVALATRNHSVFFAVALAVEQIGAYVVPVNWHLTAAEVAYIVENSESEAVIVGAGLEDVMRTALDQLGFPADRRFAVAGAIGFRDLSIITEGQPATRPEDRTAGSLMLYTSGTTGRPKGVRRPIFDVPPEQVVQMLAAMFAERGIAPGDGVYFGPAPLYHAAPGLHALLALHCGYTVVLMDGWDAEGALALVARHRATHTHLAPIHIQRWLALDEDVRSRYDMSSLKWLIHAGAPCPVEVKHRAIEWLGPVLFEYYAGSEGAFTSVDCLTWLAHPGTVGNVRGAPVEIKVVDEDTREELPAGEAGLLYAKPILPFEYHQDPEKTKAARLEDGFFTLGDIGYVDEDGWLYLVDRRTDMINSGGVNIYPAEIEDRLAGHEAVLDVAVFGAPDEQWGQRVVAIVVVKDRQQAGPELAERLSAHCRQTLAKFKCPSEIEFRSELPRLASGKLQRRVLREEFAARNTTPSGG
ncbi:MAG: AMP-binding protein [Solirubrobacteraceae bacterium]